MKKTLKKISNDRFLFCLSLQLGLLAIVIALCIFIVVTDKTEALAAEVVEPIVEEIVVDHEEILPDGLYLYCVDGAYMTVGIMETGRISGTERKAGHVTFYATTEFGEVTSTYDTVFMESEDNEYQFECVGGKYSLEYLDSGALNVTQLVQYNDLGTELGFEGEYIFVYPFDEDSYTVEGL